LISLIPPSEIRFKGENLLRFDQSADASMPIRIEIFGQSTLAIGGDLIPYLSAVLEKLLGSIVLRCRSEANAFMSPVPAIIYRGG
jgi:hypothetical protein